MITENTIYWITRLDGIRNGFTGFCVIFAIIFAICAWISAIAQWDSNYKKKGAMKFFIISVFMTVMLIISAFGRIFIPTTKEMCAIKMIPVIMNGEEVRELPNSAVELANEWIKELRPKSSKIDILNEE